MPTPSLYLALEDHWESEPTAGVFVGGPRKGFANRDDLRIVKLFPPMSRVGWGAPNEVVSNPPIRHLVIAARYVEQPLGDRVDPDTPIFAYELVNEAALACGVLRREDLGQPMEATIFPDLVSAREKLAALANTERLYRPVDPNAGFVPTDVEPGRLARSEVQVDNPANEQGPTWPAREAPTGIGTRPDYYFQFNGRWDDDPLEARIVGGPRSSSTRPRAFMLLRIDPPMSMEFWLPNLYSNTGLSDGVLRHILVAGNSDGWWVWRSELPCFLPVYAYCVANSRVLDKTLVSPGDVGPNVGGFLFDEYDAAKAQLLQLKAIAQRQ